MSFRVSGLTRVFSNQRPLCIMINNIVDAMPQSGISQADITYEMLVEVVLPIICVYLRIIPIWKSWDQFVVPDIIMYRWQICLAVFMHM